MTESKNAPRGLACPLRRATAPSSRSTNPLAMSPSTAQRSSPTAMSSAVATENASPIDREEVGADPGPLEPLPDGGETLRDPRDRRRLSSMPGALLFVRSAGPVRTSRWGRRACFPRPHLALATVEQSTTQPSRFPATGDDRAACSGSYPWPLWLNPRHGAAYNHDAVSAARRAARNGPRPAGGRE